MTNYICKQCDFVLRTQNKRTKYNNTVMDLVQHLIDEHGYLELPHKALNEYRITE